MMMWQPNSGGGQCGPAGCLASNASAWGGSQPTHTHTRNLCLTSLTRHACQSRSSKVDSQRNPQRHCPEPVSSGTAANIAVPATSFEPHQTPSRALPCNPENSCAAPRHMLLQVCCLKHRPRRREHPANNIQAAIVHAARGPGVQAPICHPQMW